MLPVRVRGNVRVGASVTDSVRVVSGVREGLKPVPHSPSESVTERPNAWLPRGSTVSGTKGKRRVELGTLKLSGTVHRYDNCLESALVDLNASKVTPIRVKAGVAVKARI